MARITSYIPEPKEEYDVENQRQILRAVDTIKNELNFSYQDDLRKELERFTWFNMRFGC
ncbi:MAG: hypothetical protein ACO3UU_17125 [Minisyncoccia bacterium]|jgi:hypothetical protein